MHRIAAPGGADRLPGVRGPGGRADRQRRGPGLRGLHLPDLPGAGGGPGPRGRSRRLSGVSPRDLARRAIRPHRHEVRSDLHPRGDPDRARGGARDGPAAGRPGCLHPGLLRRRQRQRGRLPRGGQPGRRVRLPRDPVLSEQRVGHQRARCTADRGRDLEASRGLRVPRGSRGRERRAGGVPGHEGGRRARAHGPRSHPDRSHDLSHRGAFHRRRRGPVPRRCRRGVGTDVRPDLAVPHLAHWSRARSSTTCSPPGTRRSQPRSPRSARA